MFLEETLCRLPFSRSSADSFGLRTSFGNRPQQDTGITRRVDLVLVPGTKSPEDVRGAITDLTRLAEPRVLVVVNRWPTNSLVRPVMQQRSTWRRRPCDFARGRRCQCDLHSVLCSASGS